MKPFLVGLVLVVACEQSAPRHSAIGVAGFLNTPAESLLAIGRRTSFEPSMGDSQRLMVGRHPNGRHGPRVKIEPSVDSWNYDSTELAAGQVMARMINGDSVAYPKLNLAPRDTTYWFFASGREPISGFYVSSQTRVVTLHRIGWHREPKAARQGAARFLWSDDDEKTWVYCALYYCCWVL